MIDLLFTLARDCADYYERAQELLAVLSTAGALAFASLAFAVRARLVTW